MKTHWPNTARLRNNHGETTATHTNTANRIGLSHSFLCRCNSYPDQASETGRNVASVGLTNRVRPHNAPNPIQGRREDASGNLNTYHTSRENRSALRLVSHSQVTLHLMNHGNKAQTQADHNPARMPTECLAIPRMGRTVSAENRLCTTKMKITEDCVITPRIRKTSATK